MEEAMNATMRRVESSTTGPNTGRTYSRAMPDLQNLPRPATPEDFRLMQERLRRILEVENIDRTDFMDGSYVSFISTPSIRALIHDSAELERRWEVGVFRQGDSDGPDISTFSTRGEAEGFYRRAVALEQARLTAGAAQSATVARIQQKQAKIRERMIGRLNFTKRRIRVRR